MSYFNSKNKTNAGPVITVSAQTTATVSDRVPLQSQNIQFMDNPVNNQIMLITRANTEDDSRSSKKGLVLEFDKYIKSGNYSVTDTDSPIAKVSYYETGAFSELSTSYNYIAKSGTITVKAIEASADKLHYEFDFNFKGVDQLNRELTISGRSTYIIFMQSIRP